MRLACAWWREQGWIGGDPFDGIHPTKPRSRARRKQQHRIDEARSFRDVALAAGEAGLAAAMALLMDLRASEIIERTVRDHDDGAILVIEDAKSPAGERRLEIPMELREPIAARCAGRKPGDRLFPGRSRHWVGYHVRRLCRLAKLPVIPPHGLRRTHRTISVREVSIEHVAAALGHASPAVTRRHYLAPGGQAGRPEPGGGSRAAGRSRARRTQTRQWGSPMTGALESRLETLPVPAAPNASPARAAVADFSTTAGTSIWCAKGDSNPTDAKPRSSTISRSCSDHAGLRRSRFPVRPP